MSGPEIWSASIVPVFGMVFFLLLIGDAGSSDQRAARRVKQKQLFGREPQHHPLRGRTGLRLEARQGFLTADPEEGELVRSGGLDDVDRHLDHVILGSAETLFLLDRLRPDANSEWAFLSRDRPLRLDASSRASLLHCLRVL